MMTHLIAALAARVNAKHGKNEIATHLIEALKLAPGEGASGSVIQSILEAIDGTLDQDELIPSLTAAVSSAIPD